ncbi:hypothetical protein WA026_019865 [Henosepilachna vigintioctopunctata]|uniref:TRAFD1/XAF1 zinc finger domain-containing protein n=1 Tax=Henosepilachna vigintioctopunctata TaxID=420089 RepID=A0AAW1VIM0_9CUCU
MADQEIEQEICGNCKKEIPHYNYVMHTAHCARKISLCKTCKEPVPKTNLEEHSKKCLEKQQLSPREKVPESNLERSSYYQNRRIIEERKHEEKRERYLERHEKFLDRGYSMKKSGSPSKSTLDCLKSSVQSSSSPSKAQRSSENLPSTISSANHLQPNGTGAMKKEVSLPTSSSTVSSKSGLCPCRYCDLELPKIDLEDHENYCGTRTDRCLDCGELVMFKHKQVHLDTNHGFLKLNDESALTPSWDSSTQRDENIPHISSPRRRRFQPTIYTDFSQFDPTDYLPSNYQIPKPKIEKGESYKEISRRLDCKTEYIRNLLHDSASITVPLRHNGTVPRNHFNHTPATQPPSRRRNPPTELCIPCEFCDTPIPHEELIQHETGCRPDLACLKVRSRRRHSSESDDYFVEPPSSSPEVDLPCEFCADMIPASQLLRHQATCC